MKMYLRTASFILTIVTIMSLLSGCGEIRKAETTVNNAFTALKTSDFEAAAEYMDVNKMMDSEEKSEDSINIDNNILMENAFGKIEYQIISSEQTDKNTVVVKTKITAIDMRPVLKDFFTKYLQYAFANAFADPKPSEEEMNKKIEEIFAECVAKEDLAMVTNEIDIKVVKTDKEWKIKSTDKLSDALLGGLAEALKEMNDAFNTES